MNNSEKTNSIIQFDTFLDSVSKVWRFMKETFTK